jgi:hypothetical protein
MKQREFSMRIVQLYIVAIVTLLTPLFSSSCYAWHDETHLAVAKAAGYYKWYNAAGPDIAKIKAGEVEQHNHYTNNPPGTVITSKMVMDQVDSYNRIEPTGHLYGAIIASLRDYVSTAKKGKYAQYHLAYCVHYAADLSMPLHHTQYNAFNRKNHKIIDGTVEDEVLSNLDKIHIYPVTIKSEEALAKEIARIANLSLKLGYELEAENRLLTKDEAYRQLGHSASLFKAILKYVNDLQH